MSSIHFESTYEDSELQAGIKRSNQTVGQWAKNVESSGLVVEKTFRQVTQAAGAYLSLRFAQQVGRDIISVRGEFQQLNIALETMLGSKAKADQMMSDVINRAIKSPFTVREIADQTKQIIAMGVAVEDAGSTIKMLGDVAAGTSVPLSRLAINYGQVSALGKLQQREIRDFAMAGVPIVEELATQFGKTKSEIYEMVEAGKIGFKDVEDAFKRMSGEGGKFYNLMEKQNASITGQISNLRDKIDLMLNDFGKSNEGIIYGGIESLGNLVANYKEVIDILKVLVVTYGSYKAAVIATVAVQKLSVASGNIQAWFQLASGIRSAKDAQIAFNLATKANPYGLALAGITALITALSIFRKRSEEVYLVGNEYNTTILEQKEKLSELFNEINRAKTGTDNYKKSIDSANEFLKQYNVSLTDENGNIKDLETSYKDANAAIDDFVAKQAKANELIEAGNLLTSDPLKTLQISQQKYGSLGKKLDSADIKTLQDFVKNNTDLINQSITYSTFEGVTKYVKGGKLTEFQKALSEAITGNESLENIAKFDSAKLYDFLSQSADQLTTYRDRVQEINDYYDPLLESQKKLNEEEEANLTISEQIKQTKEDILAAENELSKLRAPESTATKKDIEDQEATLKALNDRLEILTGESEKTKNKILKSEEDRLKAIRDFAEQELEIRQSLEQSKVDAMRNGYEKQREQARVNYEKELADVEEQGKKYLDKLNESKGLKITDKGYITELPADVQQNLNEQKKNAALKYSNEIVLINKNTVSEIKDIWQSATDSFISQREKEERVVIEKYDSLIKKAKELNLSQSFIDDLESKRDSSLSKITVIDWIQAFGELDKLSTSVLDNMRSKLKEYISQLSNDLNKDELKDLVETFEKIDQAISERKPLSTLTESARDYKYQTLKLNALQDQLRHYKEMKADLMVISRIEKQITDTQAERGQSASKMNKAINTIGEQGADLVSSIREFTDMLGNFGIDIGEEGDAILDGVGQIMNGLESIDLTKPASIITGTIRTLSGIGNAIAGLFGGGGSELSQATFDRYEQLMTVMDDVIQKQKELLNSMSGTDAVDASNAAIELVKKQVQATRELGNEFLASRPKNEHSYGYELAQTLKPFSEELKKLGIDFSTGIEQIFTLSPEQLDQIKTQLPKAWANIDDQTREYLQNIIDSKEEIDDINNILKEQLTYLSFDSAKESLKDLLLDANTTMSDIAQNFEEYMKKAIVGVIIDNTLKDQIQNWYDAFATAMSDNILSDAEKTNLQELYNSIYQGAAEYRDAAFNAAGIDSASGGYNSLQGITRSLTEETGSIIAGIGMAVRGDIKKIDENTYQAADYLMLSLAVQQQIAENTSHNKRLVQIETNTSETNKILNEKL